MKTLQEIKEEVAKESNYEQWSHLMWDYNANGNGIEVFMNTVAKRYARQAVIECARVSETDCSPRAILAVKEQLK